MIMETWSFYAFSFSIIALILLVIFVVITKRYDWQTTLKLSKFGVVIMLIIGLVSLADLLSKDWSIPECRDERGELIEENPKCRFP